MKSLIENSYLDDYELKWLYDIVCNNVDNVYTIEEDNNNTKIRFIICKENNKYIQKNIEIIY